MCGVFSSGTQDQRDKCNSANAFCASGAKEEGHIDAGHVVNWTGRVRDSVYFRILATDGL